MRKARMCSTLVEETVLMDQPMPSKYRLSRILVGVYIFNCFGIVAYDYPPKKRNSLGGRDGHNGKRSPCFISRPNEIVLRTD